MFLAFLQSGWFWYPLIAVVIIIGFIDLVRDVEENDVDPSEFTEYWDQHDHH